MKACAADLVSAHTRIEVWIALIKCTPCVVILKCAFLRLKLWLPHGWESGESQCYYFFIFWDASNLFVVFRLRLCKSTKNKENELHDVCSWSVQELQVLDSLNPSKLQIGSRLPSLQWFPDWSCSCLLTLPSILAS